MTCLSRWSSEATSHRMTNVTGKPSRIRCMFILDTAALLENIWGRNFKRKCRNDNMWHHTPINTHLHALEKVHIFLRAFGLEHMPGGELVEEMFSVHQRSPIRFSISTVYIAHSWCPFTYSHFERMVCIVLRIHNSVQSQQLSVFIMLKVLHKKDKMQGKKKQEQAPGTVEWGTWAPNTSGVGMAHESGVALSKVRMCVHVYVCICVCLGGL